MISTKDLRTIARARLRDAQVLLRSKRFDGAWYLCGYAVELALKARICRTLKWPGFPESAQDFKGLQSVKTHDLDILLRFSGVEDGERHIQNTELFGLQIERAIIFRAWRPEAKKPASKELHPVAAGSSRSRG